MSTTRSPGTALADPAPPVAENADAALRARRLDLALGAPLDPANPYGLPALTATDRVTLPAAPAGLRAELVPRAAGGHFTSADQLARALRPVFRRDLALGHLWAVHPLAVGELDPVPGRGAELAALLGAAGLTAAAGGVLRAAARVVDGPDRHELNLRQWYHTLAEAFADLLACESLTAVALRSLALPADDVPVLVAAVGYAVPQLVGDTLDALELVMNESGFGHDHAERRMLAKLGGDRAHTRVDWAAAADRQARLVRALPRLAHPAPSGAQRPPEPLFRLGDPAPTAAGQPPSEPVGRLAVDTALGAAATRLAEAGDVDPATVALARTARRLVGEQRAVRISCRTAADRDPADPAARALADRQALLLLAAAVLGVGQAAGASGSGFLGRPDWALLALTRITERLSVPRPAIETDPRRAVWAELARRGRQGVDCDVHATRLPW